MKKFFTIIISLSLAFALTACGTQNASSSTQNINTSSTTENSTQIGNTISVPELVGKNIEEIAKYKNEFEFEIKYEKNMNYENNIVFYQSIDPGVIVKKPAKIEICVSKRSSKIIVMPNVIGKAEQEAIDILLDAGFMYEYIALISRSNPNTTGVNGQLPAAGEKVFSDSEISVYINPQLE